MTFLTSKGGAEPKRLPHTPIGIMFMDERHEPHQEFRRHLISTALSDPELQSLLEPKAVAAWRAPS
jgi:hypothetical protein